MSNFPKWWNTTITLYNRYENPTTQQVTWNRTILKNCFWKLNHEIVSGQSISYNYRNSVLCRIPKNSKYITSYAWKSATADVRAKKFTFQTGDIIIKGSVTDSIDEYQSGQRSSDLMDKYKDLGVLMIDNVVDNSDDTRNLAHYAVSHYF